MMLWGFCLEKDNQRIKDMQKENEELEKENRKLLEKNEELKKGNKSPSF